MSSFLGPDLTYLANDSYIEMYRGIEVLAGSKYLILHFRYQR